MTPSVDSSDWGWWTRFTMTLDQPLVSSLEVLCATSDQAWMVFLKVSGSSEGSYASTIWVERPAGSKVVIDQQWSSYDCAVAVGRSTDTDSNCAHALGMPSTWARPSTHPLAATSS